ncbi:MAG: hypothetical protein IJO88_08110 [Oscillospiraceae bacterium]|nr:hypothetical protein [Oscillospiraceae bacterium]
MRQKTGLFRAVCRLMLVAAACFAMTTAVLAHSTGTASTSSISLPIIYGVIACLSLLLLLGYGLLHPRKEKWFLILFTSVAVTNLGYFVLAVSRNLGEAMLANRIAYLGSVCLPLCMLMIILQLCEMQPRRIVTSVLIGISVLVFLLAASGGYLQLYYKEVSMEVINGAAKLHKVYGPLHSVYFIYLFAYLAAMIAVIAYAAVKKQGRLRRFAPIMCTVVLLNMAIWFVEQQISWDFEFLSVSYIVSVLLLLLLHDVIPEQEAVRQPGADPYALCPQLAELTQREMDVLKLILENKKRKEIAEELFVTENTVKKHTAHIYEKLEISDRSELLLRLGGAKL